uniref:NIF system FeS cluster assembly NifU C-terminal domain-containing protein n=1 Tax=Chromera velia CCMP2878 TaxID=1169474 RepID=A0A0G4GLV4_9ALVE|eukprot:Cvel_22466.t1-p1 / transcript=Cvel_22466.t1 / gene=Cvel_22466 / organism=Chromera_velia_CCMP2878 / gene_product=NifU-like protein 2, chloroplastic, putative / transcript_product=NifU-like protein 2, chloroplastic, putative / location=Cvel_scaffold2210:22858-25959(-) / protein_length=219 / sequence_SO=supercontig / SO=protein_coding / is_pseudo=false
MVRRGISAGVGLRELRVHPPSVSVLATETKTAITKDPIISPFEDLGDKLSQMGTSDTLPLTEDNVEKVLDECRPYLVADGGNVSLKEIDGPDVYLQLEGACGSCASSIVTVQMGISRRLREKIPEIGEIKAVSASEEGEEISEAGIETVLDGVRPFLKVTGATIELVQFARPSQYAATVKLRISGRVTAAISRSVKMEIIARLRRQFPIISDVNFEGDE